MEFADTLAGEHEVVEGATSWKVACLLGWRFFSSSLEREEREEEVFSGDLRTGRDGE